MPSSTREARWSSWWCRLGLGRVDVGQRSASGATAEEVEVRQGFWRTRKRERLRALKRTEREKKGSSCRPEGRRGQLGAGPRRLAPVAGRLAAWHCSGVALRGKGGLADTCASSVWPLECMHAHACGVKVCGEPVGNSRRWRRTDSPRRLSHGARQWRGRQGRVRARQASRLGQARAFGRRRRGKRQAVTGGEGGHA